MLKKDYLFRPEKFGAVIVDKKDFENYEFNLEEAEFITLADHFGIEVAQSYTVASQNIDYQKISDLDLFDEGQSEVSKSIEELVSDLRRRIAELKRRHITHFPLELVIYPSMHCDLSCGFCFLANHIDVHLRPASEWEPIIAQAKINGVLSLSILGGEPTRYFDIDNLLRLCDQYELLTTITTNAQSIRRSTIDIIAQSNYITPIISLQSTNDRKNFELMGVPASKQVLLLKKFRKRRKKCRINAVYVNQTAQQMRELTQFCMNEGVERFSIANYSEVTGFTKFDKVYDLADLRQCYEQCQAMVEQQRSKLIVAAEGCHYYTAFPELLEDQINMTDFEEMYYGCRAKYMKMEILSNGDVLPCIAFLGSRTKASNAFETDLMTIWQEDAQYQAVRSFRTQNKQCLSCQLLKICEGGCYVTLQAHKLPQFEKDPVCLL